MHNALCAALGAFVFAEQFNNPHTRVHHLMFAFRTHLEVRSELGSVVKLHVAVDALAAYGVVRRFSRRRRLRRLALGRFAAMHLKTTTSSKHAA